MTASQAQARLDDAIAALLASEPAALADPYSLFERMRREDPVHPHGRFVFLTRYDDVHRLLQDTSDRYTKRYDRSAHLTEFVASLSPADQAAVEEYYAFVNLWMQRADLDVHARLRRISHRAFTPRRVAQMQAAVERYADGLIASFAGEEVVDLTTFAFDLPLMVIVDMLGCPGEDRLLIRDWSAAIGEHLDRDSVTTLSAAVRAIREFGVYVDEIIAGHRGRREEDDLIAALLAADEQGGLTTEELKAMFILLLFAGHETTANLIGTGTLQLLTHREQWERLCREPGRMPGAIEELLRFVSPVQWITRVAAKDHEIAGVPVPAGHVVLGIVAAANRDPAVFEDPEALDVARTGRHLGFGFGTRFCLGASLARLEGVVALSLLTARFPDMQLVDDTHAFTSNAVLRRLVRLPVRLGPDRGPGAYRAVDPTQFAPGSAA
ncbi:cytochrome P450 [Conexibacter sp. CPCC 206217]|uniref:cytochrome P450 n=1 Tax=Conexibacter sp. CPCC 206217 TaxID=3064574 RepID=UPI002718CBFD|nr:cytochrome P450 [Conexibacter sp. CPCC 206217]MDO8210111.1 cytochrome P450 [Conexibacter sp. CPCC 206217]